MQGVLEAPERLFRPVVVEDVRLGGGEVEPAERARQRRPELTELFGVDLVRGGPSRHQVDRSR